MSQDLINSYNTTNSYNTIVNANYISPDDEAKILAWLSPLVPGTRHRDIEDQQVEDIGAWLLETEEFKRWYDGSKEDQSNHTTLFCHGSPGVGKSHITWLVIDKLFSEADEDTKVIFFYFDFAARSEQSPANILGSLLGQLVSGLGKIPEVVVQTFRKQGRGAGKGLQIPGILSLFQALTTTKRIFICVDALDECAPEHRIAVLGSLRQILQGSPNTYLFMTGRSYVRSEVERNLDGAATFMLIQPGEDGILRYLHDKLQKDPTPKIMNKALEEEILETIPNKTSKIFRLASLYIKAILEGTTLADRRRALGSIGDGPGLRKAYDATLERIKAQGEGKTELAMATLTWVCYSERPLQVDELCHALAVQREATDFDQDRIPLIDILLHCCQGLITVDEEASAVRLVHYTVRNYLRNRPGFRTPHSILAETCLAYLNSRQVNVLTSRPLSDHQHMPFLQYSSRYWGTHAGRELSEHAKTLALELLDHYEDHVSAGSLLRQVIHPDCIEDIGASPRFSGLHAASFFGIVELVDVILAAGGCGVDERDCTDSTPLVWAARNGHVGVAELLLGCEDVQPDRADQYGRTPLGCAALNGHEGVVKLLLEQKKGVDPNRSDKHDETPLGWAAMNGYEGVVRLLLKRKDIDPNRPDVNDRTPLGCAAVEGHERVIRILLEQGGADPDRPDKSDQTPLWCAAFKGHEGVVKLLLEKDVDPDRPDVNNQTPLGCAAIEGHEGVVKLLLEQDDVDLDRPDKYDQTPLWCAAFKGHEGVAKLLLEQEDVDANRSNVNKQTPLGCAAIEGHEGVVKLLLERCNVDPNHLGRYNRTPLVCAAVKGHEGVVKLLLEREDIDPDRPDDYGGTPLSYAARESHGGIVKLLQAWRSARYQDAQRPHHL